MWCLTSLWQRLTRHNYWCAWFHRTVVYQRVGFRNKDTIFLTKEQHVYMGQKGICGIYAQEYSSYRICNEHEVVFVTHNTHGFQRIMFYWMCLEWWGQPDKTVFVRLTPSFQTHSIKHYSLEPVRCPSLQLISPGQNGRHFAHDIFRCILMNEKHYISIKMALKFVPKSPIDNYPALVQRMDWRRISDKPLSQPMLIQFTDAYMRHSEEMS